MTAHRDTDVVSDKKLKLAREDRRLRREDHILGKERDVLKKMRPLPAIFPRTMVEYLLREPKAIRFRFLKKQGRDLPTNRLYEFLNVCERGLLAYRNRSARAKGNEPTRLFWLDVSPVRTA